MALSWKATRNLENSLCDFLNTNLVSDGIDDINGTQIVARVGRKEDNDWDLPTITLYVDNKNLEKPYLGSNELNKVRLIIIDIYATNEGERSDLADWLVEIIKNGFTYYTYTPNGDTPDKVAGNLVHVDFVTDTRVALGQNVDVEDAHRHRISINCDINQSE